jgi:hypothetical protein
MKLQQAVRIDEIRATWSDEAREAAKEARQAKSGAMTAEEIHSRIASALTQHDREQYTKPGWNPYALGHYMGAVQNIHDSIKGGMSARQAVLTHLTGRVADKALKSISEPRATKEERRSNSW